MPILDELFKDLSPKFRQWIIILCSLSLLSVPISLAVIAINIKSFQYKTTDTEINLTGKEKAGKLTNDTEYSNKSLTQKVLDLEKSVKQLENSQDPASKKVVEDFEELKPTLTQAIGNSENLTKFVKLAISKP